MAWTEKKELTDGQKAAARMAGIPADRAGLLAEYPKAVYRAGEGAVYLGEPFKIGGHLIDTATVENAAEEADALEQGWFLTPDLKAEQARRDIVAEKDAEIDELRAQLAATEQRRGPARPPRVTEPGSLPVPAG